MSGTPSVTLRNSANVPLNIQEQPPQSPIRPLIIQPGNIGYLVVSWANWCGSPPGPLRVLIVLPSGEGWVSGPFNGPPAQVAGCMTPGAPSTLMIVNGYFSH
jgi:hypothetical protein